MIYSFSVAMPDEEYVKSAKVKDFLRGADVGDSRIQDVTLFTKDGDVLVAHHLVEDEQCHIFIDKTKLKVVSVLKYNNNFFDLTEAEIGTNNEYKNKSYTSAIYCYLVAWSKNKRLFSDITHFKKARVMWSNLCKYGKMDIVAMFDNGEIAPIEKNITIKDINDPRIWIPIDEYNKGGSKEKFRGDYIRLMFHSLNDAGRKRFKIK